MNLSTLQKANDLLTEITNWKLLLVSLENKTYEDYIYIGGTTIEFDKFPELQPLGETFTKAATSEIIAHISNLEQQLEEL